MHENRPLYKNRRRNREHFARYSQIVSVLVRYGFEDLVAALHLDKKLGLARLIYSRDHIDKINHATRWERVRLVFEELGTTFIKLGQVLSNRPDLVPYELTLELEKLQDVVPTFDGEIAVSIVEGALGKPVDQLFLRFDKTPFASASIAQVHHAMLHDNTEVVVKVQRPDLHKIVEVDIEIMRNIARVAERTFKEVKYFNPAGIVDALEKTLAKELDFRKEGEHIDKFRRRLDEMPGICAPKYYASFSSDKVLTMDLIKGFKITSIPDYQKHGIDPHLIAETALRGFFQQIFVHGFFHADPHPGNMIVTSDSKVCFIDFGMMGVTHWNDREAMATMIIGVEVDDPRRVVKSMKKLARTPFVEDEHLLEADVSELIDEYAAADLGEIRLEELLLRFRNLILLYKLPLRADFFLLFKALSNLEGIVRKLSPNIRVLDYMEPYAKRIIKRQMSPKHLLREFYLSFYDFIRLFKILPGDIRDIIGAVKQGRLKIAFEHRGLTDMQNTLQDISNRISLAILIASMLIGSSLIVNAKVPPFVHGIPVFGILGFAFSIIFALWLIISIIRSGRRRGKY